METNGYNQIYLNNTSANYRTYITNKEKYIATQEMLDSDVGFYKQTSAQGGADAIIKNIQIELGTAATNYEPYVEGTTKNIYLNEPLRKVGDAVDYIDLKNKKVVRNVKEIVLNGTEEWSNMSGNAPYKLTLNDRENEYKNNLRILSNSFETVNNMVSWVGYDSMISVSAMY